MEKLYYSIGEVAGILGESVSLVRFWSNSFPKFIKPKRNAKGNRQFTAKAKAYEETEHEQGFIAPGQSAHSRGQTVEQNG